MQMILSPFKWIYRRPNLNSRQTSDPMASMVTSEKKKRRRRLQHQLLPGHIVIFKMYLY